MQIDEAIIGKDCTTGVTVYSMLKAVVILMAGGMGYDDSMESLIQKARSDSPCMIFVNDIDLEDA